MIPAIGGFLHGVMGGSTVINYTCNYITNYHEGSYSRLWRIDIPQRTFVIALVYSEYTHYQP